VIVFTDLILGTHFHPKSGQFFKAYVINDNLINNLT
jgi:hypothetical protein